MQHGREVAGLMQGTENRTDQEEKSPGQGKKIPGEIRHHLDLADVMVI